MITLCESDSKFFLLEHVKKLVQTSQTFYFFSCENSSLWSHSAVSCDATQKCYLDLILNLKNAQLSFYNDNMFKHIVSNCQIVYIIYEAYRNIWVCMFSCNEFRHSLFEQSFWWLRTGKYTQRIKFFIKWRKNTTTLTLHVKMPKNNCELDFFILNQS